MANLYFLFSPAWLAFSCKVSHLCFISLWGRDKTHESVTERKNARNSSEKVKEHAALIIRAPPSIRTPHSHQRPLLTSCTVGFSLTVVAETGNIFVLKNRLSWSCQVEVVVGEEKNALLLLLTAANVTNLCAEFQCQGLTTDYLWRRRRKRTAEEASVGLNIFLVCVGDVVAAKDAVVVRVVGVWEARRGKRSSTTGCWNLHHPCSSNRSYQKGSLSGQVCAQNHTANQ